jgi:hypothetical protein
LVFIEVSLFLTSLKNMNQLCQDPGGFLDGGIPFLKYQSATG